MWDFILSFSRSRLILVCDGQVIQPFIDCFVHLVFIVMGISKKRGMNGRYQSADFVWPFMEEWICPAIEKFWNNLRLKGQLGCLPCALHRSFNYLCLLEVVLMSQNLNLCHQEIRKIGSFGPWTLDFQTLWGFDSVQNTQ